MLGFKGTPLVYEELKKNNIRKTITIVIKTKMMQTIIKLNSKTVITVKSDYCRFN